MFGRLCLAIVMFSLAVVAPTAPASAATTTIFVDANASASGDGSSARPFNDVPTALASARAGDVIRVRPGVYPALRIVGVRGSASSPITIEGTSSGVIFTDNAYTNRYAVLIKDSQHVTLRNVTARHALAGVMVQSSSHILIDGVRAVDTGQEGMHVQHGSHDVTIQNSFIADTGKRTDKVGNFPVGQAPGEGIYIGSGRSGGEDRVWNISILDNEITRTNHEAIDIKAPSHDILMSGNHIHDISTYVSGAVVFHLNDFETPDADIVFERNIVDGVVTTSPYRDGNCLVVSTAATIRNNVIANCQHRGIFIQDGFPATADRNVNIFHNTLYRTGNLGSLQVKSGSQARISARNNLGINSSGNRAAAGSDFMAAGTGDFRLRDSSQAIDAAQPLSSVSNDFTAGPRVVGLRADFGAFEFVPTGSTATPPSTTEAPPTTAPPTSASTPPTTGPTASPDPAITTSTTRPADPAPVVVPTTTKPAPTTTLFPESPATTATSSSLPSGLPPKDSLPSPTTSSPVGTSPSTVTPSTVATTPNQDDAPNTTAAAAPTSPTSTTTATPDTDPLTGRDGTSGLATAPEGENEEPTGGNISDEAPEQLALVDDPTSSPSSTDEVDPDETTEVALVATTDGAPEHTRVAMALFFALVAASAVGVALVAPGERLRSIRISKSRR